MRPGQGSKRSRGRGGRKPQNHFNRTFDSNGPDVKIRGSAPHINEKYLSLARDANAAGDRVAAENYLQHAEHYFRLMMLAQAQNPQNGQGIRPPYQPMQNDEDADDSRSDRFSSDFGRDYDAEPYPAQGQGQPSMHQNPQQSYGQGGQPYNQGAPQGGQSYNQGNSQPVNQNQGGDEFAQGDASGGQQAGGPEEGQNGGGRRGRRGRGGRNFPRHNDGERGQGHQPREPRDDDNLGNSAA